MHSSALGGRCALKTRGKYTHRELWCCDKRVYARHACKARGWACACTSIEWIGAECIFSLYVEERFNRFPRVLGGLTFSVFCFHILEGIVYGKNARGKALQGQCHEIDIYKGLNMHWWFSRSFKSSSLRYIIINFLIAPLKLPSLKMLTETPQKSLSGIGRVDVL
jgi:hypothetical protein